MTDKEQAAYEKEFGKRLKEVRRKRGYKTQPQFAKAFSLFNNESQHSLLNNIKKWESGQHLPEIWRIINLADFLQCDVDYLFGRINEPTHDIHFICQKTGLSEKAAELLIKWNNNYDFENLINRNGDIEEYLTSNSTKEEMPLFGITNAGYSEYIKQSSLPPGFFYGAPAIIALNNLLSQENLAYSLFEQINKYIDDEIISLDGDSSVAIKSKHAGEIDCIDSEQLKAIFLINIQNILSKYIE